MLAFVNILFKISILGLWYRQLHDRIYPSSWATLGTWWRLLHPQVDMKTWKALKLYKKVINGLFMWARHYLKSNVVRYISLQFWQKSNKNDLFSHSGAAPTTFVIMGRWTFLCLAPSSQNGRKRRYFFTQGTCSDNNDCALPGYHICVPNCLERWPF